MAEVPEVNMPRIMLLGVGGAGLNILGRARALWPEGLRLAAIDTDAQHLSCCGVPETRLIGETVTRAFSTGSSPDLGRRAAQSDASGIRAMIGDLDLLFVIAGLGGGTASGALPQIIRWARADNIMTMTFAVMPFEFEPEAARRHAEQALQELRAASNVVVPVRNDLLAEENDERTIQESLALADRWILPGVAALARIFCEDGVINLDFGAVGAMLQGGEGQAVFACTEVDREAASGAVEQLFRHPLLGGDESIGRARGGLIGLTAGNDFRLTELRSMVSEWSARLPEPAVRNWGVSLNEGMSARLGLVTLLMLAPEEEEEAGEERQDGGEGERRGRRPVQIEMDIDASPRGPFAKLEPTLFRGQNLDEPTYLRRNIRISR
ncbi:cell division protein FtsZ [Kiritimatiella glycovorans]|uniref:Cell division protein FtsZ n=1 Tax=Kiritimatiella glycovorans TaxID=1307763 RepID=A0A0G3EB72_9BACT|nr:hypothetical protein [Kiritimatiella glycovorans]AKJ63746.1 Cell division protein FtsZ [Kiritimatiella glycovorans]